MYRDFCACFQSTVQIRVHPLLWVLHDPACLHLLSEYRGQCATVMPWDGVQGQLAAAFVLCDFCDPPHLLLVCFFVCVLFFSLPAFCHLFDARCLRSSQVRAIMARIKRQSEPGFDLINFCYSDRQ